MKKIIKPAIFVCLLAVLVILVVTPVKMSAVQIPGVNVSNTIPVCMCPQKPYNCGCWLPG